MISLYVSNLFIPRDNGNKLKEEVAPSGSDDDFDNPQYAQYRALTGEDIEPEPERVAEVEMI